MPVFGKGRAFMQTRTHTKIVSAILTILAFPQRSDAASETIRELLRD
jgi:hypothetical protein